MVPGADARKASRRMVVEGRMGRSEDAGRAVCGSAVPGREQSMGGDSRGTGEELSAARRARLHGSAAQAPLTATLRSGAARRADFAGVFEPLDGESMAAL